MARRRTVLILTGEPSGDRAAAPVAAALRRAEPGIRVRAVGGPHLQAAGAEIIRNIDELAAMGFLEVVRQVPRLKALEQTLVDVIRDDPPDVVMPVDYPGFNLRIAKHAKEAGIPVVYYIGPQVWAWGAGRIPKIASVVDRMLVVFPFEQPLYADAGVPTDFVGHPLLDGLADRPTREAARTALRIPDDTRVVGMLPGSRVQEIRRILPTMAETARRLLRSDGTLRVVVSVADSVDRAEFDRVIGSGTERLELFEGPAAFVTRAADALLVTSGTATLESALDGTPLAVVYRTSPVTWFLGTRLVKITRISLVNIVAEDGLVREFLQHEATPEAIAPHLSELLADTPERDALRGRLAALKDRLGQPGVADRVAAIVREEARVP